MERLSISKDTLQLVLNLLGQMPYAQVAQVVEQVKQDVQPIEPMEGEANGD